MHWHERNVEKHMSGYKKIAVVGCDGCAKACKTGGSEQVAEFAAKLREQSKEIVLATTPERTCYMNKTRTVLEQHVEELKQPR